MRGMWDRLFHRNGSTKLSPAVKKAKEIQDEQFREWNTVLTEVERAQEVARGGQPRPQARH